MKNDLNEIQKDIKAMNLGQMNQSPDQPSYLDSAYENFSYLDEYLKT